MGIISYRNVFIEHVKDAPIIEDASFEIEKGSITALLGPNGSGKSTLMSTMNRLKSARSGKILIEGHEIDSMRPKELAKKVAFVSQFSENTFNYSVEDAILWGRAPYISYLPRSRDHEIVEETMNRLEISHLRKKTFNAISGGERQMVLVARAIAQRSPVILMDEPTTYLDVRNQARILNIIKELNKNEKVTFIVTLHDPNHAMFIADNVAMIKDGRIEMDKAEQMLTEEKLEGLYGVKCGIKQGISKFIEIDYSKFL